ncbi:MAG: hypothetical protein HUJ25_05080 [Crocinitomicaceae bacterium]|nr:hypothetical protein [Crocinitomicaceae bacterium]
MNAFLTFNDSPSGVYRSQVIEVLRILNQLQDEEFVLLAFIPRQNYKANKEQIKRWYPRSKVYPILPGLRYWKASRWLFSRVNRKLKPKLIISRGVVAAHFALYAKNKEQKIIYDGRGAIKAEQEEFAVYSGSLGSSISEMEKDAVLNTDFRISVTEALVKYWQDTFGYNNDAHVVIPCLSSAAQTDAHKSAIKDSFFDTQAPILVYSGSTSPWQSFPLLIDKVSSWLRQTEGKVLFLTRPHEDIKALVVEFGDRVKNLFVAPERVSDYLLACDYGLLIREDKVTNQVASPVKYAEYLSAGLEVIISDCIEDYATFTKEYNTGLVIKNSDQISTTLSKRTGEAKKEIKEIYREHLSAENYYGTYRHLLQCAT